MEEKDFQDSRASCYSLAHTIAANGMMQQKLVNDLQMIELTEVNRVKIIKDMLKTLASNFT